MDNLNETTTVEQSPYARATQERTKAAGRMTTEQDFEMVRRIYLGEDKASFTEMRVERPTDEPTLKELTGVDDAPDDADRYVPDTLAEGTGLVIAPEARRDITAAAREYHMPASEANSLARQAIELLGLAKPSAEQIELDMQRATETLKAEWHHTYHERLERIADALAPYPQLVAILEESGLGRSVSFLRRLDELIDTKERRERIAAHKTKYGSARA